jgi:hypothetical protein
MFVNQKSVSLKNYSKSKVKSFIQENIEGDFDGFYLDEDKKIVFFADESKDGCVLAAFFYEFDLFSKDVVVMAFDNIASIILHGDTVVNVDVRGDLKQFYSMLNSINTQNAFFLFDSSCKEKFNNIINVELTNDNSSILSEEYISIIKSKSVGFPVGTSFNFKRKYSYLYTIFFLFIVSIIICFYLYPQKIISVKPTLTVDIYNSYKKAFYKSENIKSRFVQVSNVFLSINEHNYNKNTLVKKSRGQKDYLYLKGWGIKALDLVPSCAADSCGDGLIQVVVEQNEGSFEYLQRFSAANNLAVTSTSIDGQDVTVLQRLVKTVPPFNKLVHSDTDVSTRTLRDYFNNHKPSENDEIVFSEVVSNGHFKERIVTIKANNWSELDFDNVGSLINYYTAGFLDGSFVKNEQGYFDGEFKMKLLGY